MEEFWPVWLFQSRPSKKKKNQNNFKLILWPPVRKHFTFLPSMFMDDPSVVTKPQNLLLHILVYFLRNYEVIMFTMNFK